jgi:lysophospholipid acyltransferase (LPLAT)-like uncharacterized protein
LISSKTVTVTATKLGFASINGSGEKGGVKGSTSGAEGAGDEVAEDEW